MFCFDFSLMPLKKTQKTKNIPFLGTPPFYLLRVFRSHFHLNKYVLSLGVASMVSSVWWMAGVPSCNVGMYYAFFVRDVGI